MANKPQTAQSGHPRPRLTYKQKLSGADLFRFVKAIALPVMIFVLSLIAIQALAGFGAKLVAPLTALMLIIGPVCAIILPSHRSSILTETMATTGIYLVSLMGFKFIISMMSGISSETFMEVFNQSMPVTSGTAISGWLQTLMWITAVMTPIGFVSMQIKRIFTFKRKASKEKFIEQTRGIRLEQDGHRS